MFTVCVDLLKLSNVICSKTFHWLYSYTYRPSCSSEKHGVGYSIVEIFSHCKDGIISTDIPCRVVPKGAAGVCCRLVVCLKAEVEAIVTHHRAGVGVLRLAAKPIHFCVSVAAVTIQFNLEDVFSFQCVLCACQ